LDDLLQVQNTTNIATNQAEISKKGRIPLTNLFTYATSNTPLANIKTSDNVNDNTADDNPLRKYYRVNGGVVRRFPVVFHFSIKPEYQVEGSPHQLRSDLPMGTDIYCINIYTVEIVGSGNAFYVPKHLGVDREFALGYLRDFAIAHFAKATQTKDYNTELLRAPICSHRMIAEYCSMCKVAVLERVEDKAFAEAGVIRTKIAKNMAKFVQPVLQDESERFFGSLYDKIVPPALGIIISLGAAWLIYKMVKKARSSDEETEDKPDPPKEDIPKAQDGIWDELGEEEEFPDDDPRALGLTRKSMSDMLRRTLFEICAETDEGKVVQIGFGLATSSS
jgi:hypothetical protein